MELSESHHWIGLMSLMEFLQGIMVFPMFFPACFSKRPVFVPFKEGGQTRPTNSQSGSSRD